MAVTYIGTTAVYSDPTNPTVIAVPVGTQDGDLMILFVGSYANWPGTPTGWTKVGDFGDYPRTIFQWHYKVASSEPASYNISHSWQLSAWMITLRGQHPTTPIDTHSETFALELGSYVLGSLNAAKNGSMFLAMGGNTWGDITWTKPAGMTTEVSPYLEGNTNYPGATISYKVVGPGATGDQAFGHDLNSNHEMIGVIVAPIPFLVQGPLGQVI